MKKTTFLLLSLLFFALLIAGVSCTKERCKSQTPALEPNTVYRVGIHLGEYEGTGEITLLEDGTVHLFHADSTSPLFTMEEIIEKDRIGCKFLGMEWETDEAAPYSTNLYQIFQILCSQKYSKKESESIRGVEAIKETYDMGEKQLIFYRSKENNEPIQIFFFDSEGTMEIAFELEAKP